ncbi:hypothetical protein, partial [Salmonella enterica]|uniref:hypothetical protein n=1 Tax=Salmonella enterica TaxID=28901 RepID=UPI000CC7EF63
IDIQLLTNDILLEIKAESYGINVHNTDKGTFENRKGVEDFYYNPENQEHQEILSKIEELTNTTIAYNPPEFNLEENEYLVVWDVSQPTYKRDRF